MGLNVGRLIKGWGGECSGVSEHVTLGKADRIWLLLKHIRIRHHLRARKALAGSGVCAVASLSLNFPKP